MEPCVCSVKISDNLGNSKPVLQTPKNGPEKENGCLFLWQLFGVFLVLFTHVRLKSRAKSYCRDRELETGTLVRPKIRVFLDQKSGLRPKMVPLILLCFIQLE